MDELVSGGAVSGGVVARRVESGGSEPLATTHHSPVATDQLLQETAAWRLIGLLFEVPTAADWRQDVNALASEIAAEDVQQAAQAAILDASEGLYHAAIAPSGRVSLREVTYRQSMTPGQFLSEIAAFYKAFAYQPSLKEAPDHIAIQIGFISYLRMKEAFSLVHGNAEEASIAADAARKFADEHLKTLASRVAEALQNCPARYLQLAAEAVVRRVGVSTCPSDAVLPNCGAIEEDCSTCGAAPGAE
ncbi:MAG TPA: molecular chaperone TorD family protein [Planctomycetota bacterium]|jgi:nitrate reductase assembly molybdenum cofactor insertion protein NarJ